MRRNSSVPEIADLVPWVLTSDMQRYAPRPIVTAQQDLLLADIAPDERLGVETLLREHGVTLAEDLSPIAKWTLACVALPSCGQSLAEGERDHIRDGRLVGLAVTSAKRAPSALEIPTIAETIEPGFDQVTWMGVLAPAGTPNDLIPIGGLCNGASGPSAVKVK
jgi:hypothetical protein